MRSAVDAGRSIDDVMRSLKPQPHFKQKPALEQQCRQWTVPALDLALRITGDAAKAARLKSAMEVALAENLLLELGTLAKRPGAGR
jgi:DNA polymerase III delta subunit